MKASIPKPTAMASVILLSSLFHSKPTFADGSHAELRSRFQIRHECLVRNRWRLLESTRSLGWTNWQRAVEALTTNNGRLEVTAPFDQPGRFFRLRKP